MAGRHYTKLGYCDEVDIENFLLLDIDDTFSDQVEDWIAAAEKQVNNFLGYTTASGILAEEIVGEKAKSYVDTDSNLKIYPRKTPIISISSLQLVKGSSSLTIDLENSGTARYDIPTSNDYIAFPEYELSVTGASIINSFGSLRSTQFYSKINYIAGYTEVPSDIRLATVNLVSDTIMRHTNKEGLESIVQGRVTKRWRQRNAGESDFYLDAMTLLRPYRMASRWL